MKFRSFILCLIGLVGFGGCFTKGPSFDIFAQNNELSVGDSFIPLMNPKLRKIHDDTSYIYTLHFNKSTCVVGFLTNRDDKPEVVQDWIILSGKEFCKERQGWILSF